MANATFHVVEVKEPLSEEAKTFVCVPEAWVLHKDSGPQPGQLVFKYPSERMSITKRRIKEDPQTCLQHWPMHLGVLKYTTDNLDNINLFIKLLEKSSNDSTSSKRRRMNEDYRERSRRSSESSSSDDVAQTVRRVGIYHASEKHAGENLGSQPGPSSATNQRDKTTVKASQVFEELKRQAMCIDKLHQELKEYRNLLFLHTGMLHDIVGKLKKPEENVRQSEPDTQTVNQPDRVIPKRRQSVREETPRVENVSPSRSAPLSQDNEETDSRWTLRYQHMAPGLEELMKNTGVYIDSIRFANCKRIARDDKSLARLLLLEIFNQKALATCSLTGARSKVFDPDGTHTRPGLDERARNVMLNFVESYCHEKQWVSADRQAIMSTLRNKMQEIRSKYR